MMTTTSAFNFSHLVPTLSGPCVGSNRPKLLVFSDDWGRHPSSCQHLVRRLREDFDVLWVNTVGTRQVKANAFTLRRGLEKLKNWRQGLKQIDDRMWTVDVPMLPGMSSRL